MLEKNNLTSQPTISRANNRLDLETMKQQQQANFTLLDKVYRIQPPQEIIMDLDSTISETHGEQYGSCYNTHYATTGYHPLVLFYGKPVMLLKQTCMQVMSIPPEVLLAL